MKNNDKSFDTGCFFAASCLECPHPVCVEDEPLHPSFKGIIKRQNAKELSTREESGVADVNRDHRIEIIMDDVEAGELSIRQMATKWGVSSRTIHRIAAKVRRENVEKTTSPTG